jgi:hypothetical protein
LAIVEGGWEQHRRRFAGYERSVKRFANRLRPLWDVTLDQYGPGGPVGPWGGPPVDPDSGSDGASLLDGYRVFCDVHDHSWKTPLTAAMRAQAQALLRRAEPHGWARVYVLRVTGRPAAAHIWFRLGSVATWLETAYDQRLAAIGPGSILMWWSQERIFADSPPGVVDFIPGHNPQKDRLGPDRSAIVILEAARRTLVSGATSRCGARPATSCPPSPSGCSAGSAACGRSSPTAGSRAPAPWRCRCPAAGVTLPSSSWSWTPPCGGSWPP